MARTILTISSELFDDPSQEASIRENLPIRTLLAETRKEFDLPDGNYTLTIKSNGRVLDPEKTLEQSGVQTGAVLILNRERRASSPVRDLSVIEDFPRRVITSSVQATLREEATGQVFEIKWQPAIIGRPDGNNPASANMLAVNLGPLEGSKAVSRHHAGITEQDGQYFVESMSSNNPTYLNDGLIRSGERRFLESGDKIRVGHFILTFETQKE